MSELHVDDILEVIVTDDGYILNGVLTDEDDIALMSYIENDGVILDEGIDPIKEHELEVLQQSKEYASELGTKYTERSGLISALQKSALGTPKEQIIDIIIRFTSVPVEKWKNTGNTATLRNDLNVLTGVQIRACLDIILEDGSTLTDHIITQLTIQENW